MYGVMTLGKAKDAFLQIRIREEVKRDLGILAELKGLSMSALINSLIVKAIRDERMESPAAFPQINSDEHTKRSKELPDYRDTASRLARDAEDAESHENVQELKNDVLFSQFPFGELTDETADRKRKRRRA